MKFRFLIEIFQSMQADSLKGVSKKFCIIISILTSPATIVLNVKSPFNSKT